MNREEQLLKKRILDLANLCCRRDIPSYTDFLNLNEQTVFHSLERSLPPVRFMLTGGYEPAERKIVCFLPSYEEETMEPPIRILEVKPVSPRFAEALTHRDYLGALLNLGVDRAMIGDILVQEKAAWFFCNKKMTDFFLKNLCRVRHTNILITVVDKQAELPAPKTETIHGTCASVRLDSLIALAFKASRSSMVSYIEGGQVFVNGKLITSNGYEPREGDIISVRGKGRFIYDGTSHQTRKGRSSIQLSLYI